MYNVSAYRTIDWGRFFGFLMLALVAMFMAAFFGLASAVLPYHIALALMLIPCTVILAIFNVELALLIAACAIFGIIPVFVQPAIPVGGIVIRTGESLLLMLGGLVVIKTLYRPTAILESLTPLKYPLAVLGILYVVSIAYSVGIKRDEFGLAETRNLVGWVALPVAIYAFTWNFHRMDRYLRFVAALVAVLLIAQTLLGARLIFAERGAELISQEFSDVIRGSAGAANFLLAYALYYALGRASEEKNKLPWVLLVNLMALGLAVTFTRGAWFAALAGMFVFFFITRAHRRMVGTLLLSAFFASALAGALLILKPQLIGAVEERLLSVAEEGKRGSSVGYRLDENRQAFEALTRNPVLGVGIGGEYKEYTGTHGREVAQGEFTYIHNSYLGMAVKFGVLGAIVPFWIFRNLWQEWKRHRPARYADVTGYQLNIAAAFSALAMYMVNGLTQPEWLRLGGLVVLSVLLALILAASRHLDNATNQVQAAA